MMSLRLSHTVFFFALITLFGTLWLMVLNIIARDGFSWGVVIFSFITMCLAGGVSTVKERG